LSREFRIFVRVLPTLFAPLIVFFGLCFPKQFDFSETVNYCLLGVTIFLSVAGFAISVFVEVEKDSPEPGPLKQEAFLRLYTKCLRDSIGFLPLAEDSDLKTNLEALQNNLQNLCLIAEAYKNDAAHHHQFNSCYYHVIKAAELTKEQQDYAKDYMDKGRTTYSKFLVLKEWAYNGDAIDPKNTEKGLRPTPCVSVGFTLPVDANNQYILIGAPEACSGNKITYVPDIKNEKFIRRQQSKAHSDITETIVTFFHARRSYRSFISLPVRYKEKVVGVVCVQSSQTKFCTSSKRDMPMRQSMEPFLDIIALLVLE
jgi:hypothetical protein